MNGSIQILRFGSSNDPKNRARFFTVFNVYAPTAPAISEDSAANYTIWADELIRLVQKEKKNNTRILIIGDLNLAPINILDRESSHKRPTPGTYNHSTVQHRERKLWEHLVNNLQMIDVFRTLHP